MSDFKQWWNTNGHVDDLSESKAREVWCHQRDKINKLLKEIDKLRECVEYYADVESYNLAHVNQQKGYATNLVGDDHVLDKLAGRYFGGRRARQCLKDLEGKV